jgi:hypothetical protein
MAESKLTGQQFFEVVGGLLILLIVVGLASIECNPTSQTTVLGHPLYSCSSLGDTFTEKVEGSGTSEEPDFLAKLQAYWLHLVSGGLSLLAIAWVVLWILPRK